MSPSIEVLLQIRMQLQARGILNTSSLASKYCQHCEFYAVTGICRKTIFNGNHLMKDCRHNCCSEEFTSLERLFLEDFAAPYIGKRCNYVLMIINTRVLQFTTLK